MRARAGYEKPMAFSGVVRAGRHCRQKGRNQMRSRLALALVSCVSVVLSGQPASKGSLLVLAKSDLTLSIVDPSTLEVLATVPSGPDPHEVIPSSDGRTAYISNYGGGAFNTLTVVDLVNRKPLSTIDLGALRGPHGLVFVGGKPWFTAEAAKAIGRYDPAAKAVDLILGTGQDRTHMIWVSQDARRIVTSNVSSATMTIFERTEATGGRGGRGGGRAGPPRENWDAAVVPAGGGVEGFDVSPDGKEIWAANAQDGTITVIDMAGRKVSQTIAANVRGANRLKFTPDGRRVLVSSLSAPDVAVFDAGTRREIKRIPVGRGAAGIEVQPDGARAFVACSPDNYVAVIDLATLEVTGHVEAGRNPDGMAWVPAR
jgi:YVTN family beta-propeller protein